MSDNVLHAQKILSTTQGVANRNSPETTYKPWNALYTKCHTLCVRCFDESLIIPHGGLAIRCKGTTDISIECNRTRYTVTVEGKNLTGLTELFQRNEAEYIQLWDPRKWEKIDESRGVITAITIQQRGGEEERYASTSTTS